MRAKVMTGVFPKVLLVLMAAFELSLQMAGQQPPHCAQDYFCLFNQEAAASDPSGIHKYSEDLVGLIVPPEAGKVDMNLLADRLARAEQIARTGTGKLVAEADVVRAFNELMAKIGAPSSMRAGELPIRRFREHAASIKAFPELLTGDRNRANCYPGEAVFLFYLLISNNGVLSEQDIDISVALMRTKSQSAEGSSGFLTARMEVLGSNASTLVSSYSSHHDGKATIALFNHAADILGF